MSFSTLILALFLTGLDPNIRTGAIDALLKIEERGAFGEVPIWGRVRVQNRARFRVGVRVRVRAQVS